MKKIYKEYFDLMKNSKSVYISSVDDNTDGLIKIIDQFLRNPYNVQIGEMDVKFNKYNREMVDVVVPVEYGVKNSLIQDLLLNIPHEKLVNSSGLVQLKFSNSNFKFDPQLVEKLAYMKYQVFIIMIHTLTSEGLRRSKYESLL